MNSPPKDRFRLLAKLTNLALHQNQHHQQFRVSHHGLVLESIASLLVHNFSRFDPPLDQVRIHIFVKHALIGIQAAAQVQDRLVGDFSQFLLEDVVLHHVP